MFGIFTYGERLNNLFQDAVALYLISQSEDALEVSANCIATAGKAHRQQILQMLEEAPALMAKVILMNDLTDGTEKTYKELVLALEQKTLEIKILSEKMIELGLYRSRDRMRGLNRKIVQKADRETFRRLYGWELVSHA